MSSLLTDNTSPNTRRGNLDVEKPKHTLEDGIPGVCVTPPPATGGSSLGVTQSMTVGSQHCEGKGVTWIGKHYCSIL